MTSVLIFIDKKAPPEAKRNLTNFGEVVELQTHNIVYEAISGHPDIFIFQQPGECVIAPQLPDKYVAKLRERGVAFRTGIKNLSGTYPGTAAYNALYTAYGIIHNKNVGSEEILGAHSRFIHCNQAYARCNAIAAGGVVFTSDKGIEQALLKLEIPVLYVNPESILLQGFSHGFFGGCCGIFQKYFFVCGSLQYLPGGEQVKAVLQQQGLECIELYDGPLLDTGGILFLPSAVDKIF